MLTKSSRFRLQKAHLVPRVSAKKSRGHRRRTTVGFISAGALLLLAVALLPVDAATTGSNQSIVLVPPEPIRSVTVSPEEGTSFYCPADIVPNGRCFIGSYAEGRTTGGITITNGSAPSDIYVNGASAIPSVASGKPWALVDLPTTGPDQFAELTEGGPSVTNLLTTPQCDKAFDVAARGCAAAPQQTEEEQLVIVGPSSSTGSGTFEITTTWTALPPA
jgi:hypothetical protein